MTKIKDLITGTGRRKTAVARVFVTPGAGDILVNDVPIETYFADVKYALGRWKRPFNVVGLFSPKKKFNFSIRVSGSGKMAQLGAVVHGISWALASMNEDYATELRRHGLLTRDPRMVERKKYWLRKARKAPQYSKR